MNDDRPGEPHPKAPRSLQLDFLRGIAILLVLGHHPPERALPDFKPLAAVNRAWENLGWSGVDLFFVLSGFLIGGLLFEEIRKRDDLDVRRFLIRRGLKIYPSMWAYLLFVSVLLLTGPRFFEQDMPYAYKNRPWEVFKLWATHLLAIQNYHLVSRGHTWSLAVEEHFYLALPFLLMFLIRRRRKDGERVASIPEIPFIAAGLILTCTFWRILLKARRPSMDLELHLWTHLRIDGLFLGVLLAYLHHYRPDFREACRSYRYWLLAAGLALVGPFAYFSRGEYRFVQTVGFSLLYFGYGAILLALISIQFQGAAAGKGVVGRFIRTVAVIGVYSYPIYLLHLDLANTPMTQFHRTGLLASVPKSLDWILMMGGYIALSTGVGVLLSLAIEQPVLAIRERIFPRRSVPLETTSDAPTVDATLPVPA